MKMKNLGTMALALVTVLAMTATAFAATPAPATKTITFNSYQSDKVNAPATVKVTNVTKTETKDYSAYMSDDDITIEATNAQVLTCKAPVTVTLMPNKGTKATGAFAFLLTYDFNLIDQKSVTTSLKYYKFDAKKAKFDTSKKLTLAQAGKSWGVADSSSMKITKPGTYVLWVDTAYGVDKDSVARTPVFLVVEK